MEGLSKNYEAGKHYYVEFTVKSSGAVDFVRNELTDPARLAAAREQISLYKTALPQRIALLQSQIKERDAYLAFSKANPDYFDWQLCAGSVAHKIHTQSAPGNQKMGIAYKEHYATLL